MVRRPKRSKKPEVHFRQFWGINKRVEILESLKAENFRTLYEKAEPGKENRFSFLPSRVTDNYLQWPRIPDLAAIPSYNGPVERRGMALISIERPALVARMAAYFDKSVNNGRVAQIYPSLMMTGNRIVGPEARKKILAQFVFDPSRIVRYPFKPFDLRWCYLENLRPLFSEPSPQLLEQRFKGNAYFITRDTADKAVEGPPFYFSSFVCDYDCISGHARHFPIRLRATRKMKTKRNDDGNGEFGSILQEAAPAYDSRTPRTLANLSTAARAYLNGFGAKDPDADAATAALLWMHALAIGFSPAYLAENADGVRQDWPRIPLPDSKATLLASAALGKQIASLLDTETPLTGVADGNVRHELKGIAEFHFTGDVNFRLTAGWGHAGQGGVTMPGKGKLLTRSYRPEEQPPKPLLGLLGNSTHDIYLNDTAYWRNVPEKVWDFTIGGYQVVKKWLSYREHGLLGRALTPDEAREVTHTARRLAALLLLTPALDANYAAAKACATPLP